MWYPPIVDRNHIHPKSYHVPACFFCEIFDIDKNYIFSIECSIIEGVDWNINVSPRYRLRPDKFIVPVFTYGPNNQLHGFRESIFMAIKLNRTIIAPPFFKHSRNDITAAEEGDEVVDTFLRLGEFWNDMTSVIA